MKNLIGWIVAMMLIFVVFFDRIAISELNEAVAIYEETVASYMRTCEAYEEVVAKYQQLLDLQ